PHAPLPTYIHTRSLHDALPICFPAGETPAVRFGCCCAALCFLSFSVERVHVESLHQGNKGNEEFCPPPRAAQFVPFPLRTGKIRSEETRLNSSHLGISYAVFCL